MRYPARQNSTPSRQYAYRIRKRLAVGALFFAVLVIVSWWSLNTGAFQLSWKQIFGLEQHPGADPSTIRHILYKIRLPRLVAAVFSGASLALAGCVMQNVLRNQYFASDFQVAATVFWTFGDVGKAGWVDCAWIGGIFALTAAVFFRFRWKYNFMLWGDETAGSMGVRTNSFRLLTLTGSALLATVTISFLGIIGFIGLMAPHIARLIVGDDYRFLLLYSALAGSCLLVTADTLARIVMVPHVLPVGILTAFAGAPLFLYLLIRRKGEF